ncbi:hypothetical protein NPX13_g8403 [Xylaria arbuscula]|uniref:BZIP domain-containing protein n=1 Tax=Xylaria arbuscula TaxID=114810 RepID=A0A9W8TK73_9PEZI|nr:hypothetical protein NPX13_g8403 [Xylaria arbuscula]
MDPPAFSTSDLSIPVNYKSLPTNAHSPTDLEGPSAGIDRRTKKRIQNRVAQRTYRTRIKQRLHDLQQQVHQLQQKEGEQQHNTGLRKNETDDDGHDDTVFYPPFNQATIPTPFREHRADPYNLEVSCQNTSGMSSTASTAWSNITSQWNPPLGGPNFLYNPVPLRTRPTLDLSLESTIPPLSPPRPGLDVPRDVLGHPVCHGEQSQDALSSGRRNEGNIQNQLHKRVGGIYYPGDHQEQHPPHEFGVLYPSSWSHNLDAHLTTAESITATKHAVTATPPNIYQNKVADASLTGAATQWPGNWIPDHQETMEQIEEIRKRSTTWSALQRRGYENAMLKAAEEICAVEYHELRTAKINKDVSEAALGEMLPSLYALLTGVVSSNPKLSQRQVSETVFWSMRVLCGLDGPHNHSTGSSRQSPT